jgi:ABC-type transporter Mla subunit MlaD
VPDLGRHTLNDLVEQEQRLQKGLAGRVAAPFDAIFDLLEESGTTMRSQADALESAGRALQEAAALMKTQAELFERTVGTLRKPSELVKSVAGLEPHPTPGHRESRR